MLLLLGIDHLNAQYGPVVSFTYDDGYSSWYDIGFPVFQEYGFPGVVYINELNTWIQYPGTINKLQEMQAAGWEISSHTRDHQPVSLSNVSLMKNWLDSLGFLNSGFAAPGHDWSHDKVNIVKKYHTYYSATSSQEGGLSQPLDLYLLKRFGLTNEVPIQDVISALDDAVANNKWIIFYGHVFGEAPQSWEQSDSLLRGTFDAIVERGIPVKTVNEVIKDLFPPGCLIECSVDSLQDPVLTYFEDGGSFSTSVWNEYWHNFLPTEPRFYGSPAVYCHTSNDSLPVMKFYRNVPNGEYEVYASILPYDPGRTYRLYYSFDSVNTSQYNVDVNKNTDVSLGTVTITNGQFSLYTQKADAITGSDGYVGWAFVKLIAKPILVNLKVFLEGSYNGSGTMTTTLQTQGVLPKYQPFKVTPWNYLGTEAVATFPTNVVDWVLVELRTGTAATTTVAKRAAFLKSDGSIVDLDGLSQVKFKGITPGNYYIVIRHRNHLAIMSANPISLNYTNSLLYDFTTAQTQAYGTDPMVALTGGGFGMIAADANVSGIITAADVISIINNLNVSNYLGADINMSAIVTASDVTSIILNLNKVTNVPD